MGLFSWATIFESIKEKKPTALIHIIIIALGAAVLFLVPYVLWARGTVPRYSGAIPYSLLLSIASVLVGRMHLQRCYPELFKVKRKRKIAELLARGELVSDEEEAEQDTP
jgi:hypothetical protein